MPLLCETISEAREDSGWQLENRLTAVTAWCVWVILCKIICNISLRSNERLCVSVAYMLFAGYQGEQTSGWPANKMAYCHGTQKLPFKHKTHTEDLIV